MLRMNKYFTIFYSAEGKYGTKNIFYSSKTVLLKDTFEKTTKLLNTVRLSPDQEVINKILEFAD